MSPIEDPQINRKAFISFKAKVKNKSEKIEIIESSIFTMFD